MRGWWIQGLALAAFVASCGGKSELDKTGGGGGGGGGSGGRSDGGGSGGNAGGGGDASATLAFEAETLAIAGEYLTWGRVDDELRWAPFLCRQPLPGHRPPERIDRPDHPRRQAVFGVRQAPLRLPERPAHRPGRGEAVVEDRAGDGPGRVVQPGHLAPEQRRRRSLLSVRRRKTASCTARPSPPVCSSCSRSIPRRPTPMKVGSMRRCRPLASSRRRGASAPVWAATRPARRTSACSASRSAHRSREGARRRLWPLLGGDSARRRHYADRSRAGPVV